MALLRDLLRSAVTSVGAVLMTIVCAIAAIVISRLSPRSHAIERVIHVWSWTWLRLSGTRLRVIGADNVDTSRSYVVVANHESTFDIMACFLALPVPIRFLAKKELFRIPVLAQGMRAIGIVEVDREARGLVHNDVNRQAKELIAKGRSLIIYAEGTRPRDGVMRSFRKGAFTMAVTAQLPIVPLSIHGSYQAWAPAQPWIRGGRVKVIIDKPIETDGLAHSDTTELRNQAHEVIAGRVRAMGGKVRGD